MHSIAAQLAVRFDTERSYVGAPLLVDDSSDHEASDSLMPVSISELCYVRLHHQRWPLSVDMHLSSQIGQSKRKLNIQLAGRRIAIAEVDMVEHLQANLHPMVVIEFQKSKTL